ncbi:MAG: hypothetical protein ACM359_03575 [Bacillota bacterium]
MYRAQRRILTAVAATLSLGTAVSWATEPASREARLQELENKVAALEAQEATNSKDLANTVDSVLRDAERRSQLLANGGDTGAGYDNGFYIRAGDAWVLRPAAQFQFRNVTNFREDAQSDDDNDWENGFEVRRMRLDLGGTAFSKDLQYFIQWESNRNGGNLSLLEAWAKYMFSDQFGFWVGQVKDQVTHEFIMSSKNQLAADTSLMDSLVGGGNTSYVQGAYLVYGNYNKDNPLNAVLGYTDGAASLNTDYVTSPFDYGINGRLEYKVMGDWKNYRDFTAKATKDDLLVLGAATDFSERGDGNQITSTADVQYENPMGLGLYGAFVDQYQDADFTGTDSANNLGFLAQASYAFSGNWEVFGRYDQTLFDNDQALKQAGASTGDLGDSFPEITVGVNYYMGQDGSALHRAKFTVDLSYLPNGTPRSVTGLGMLDDNNGNAEWILRAQFQLLI